MTLMKKEIFEQPQILAALKEKNKGVLEALCSEIKSRNDIKYVVLAARGTSDHASIYAQYIFGKFLGLPCALATPSVITAYGSSLDLSGALVIGVSQSGAAADALAVLEEGKKCGAITVAVTNNENSPLAKTAKFHLFCNCGEEKSVAATKTFTSEMYLLALIVEGLSGNKELTETLNKIPGAVQEALDTIPQKLDTIIERYRYMTCGFVLGRGMSYPVALEMRLKLQETNYVKMNGYAVSDFHHGPLAQIEVGTPVILFAPKGPVYKDCVEMLNKLESIGAEIILVSDDKELIGDRKLGFLIPDLGNDYGAAFVEAVFAQLFAEKLTSVKGLNPDAPRNLSKVTITK